MINDYSMPEDACDCHAHVLGPYARWPLAASAAHVPPEAIYEAYRAMLDAAGFKRGVLVHPGVYGFNYGVMLDALARGGGRLAGVAVATAEVADSRLAELAGGGVRALRYTEVRARGGNAPAPGKAVFADFEATRSRLREHGLHAEFWADCDHFVAQARRLAGAGVELVLDHAGLFDAAAGVTAPAFQDLLALLREGLVWVKLPMHRNAPRGTDLQALRPFHDALVEANPERLVWGSDWPWLGVRPFGTTELRDLMLGWVPDPGLRRRILSSNPARLYRF
jgi:2-pyrone-4,6-dicarboxylate lactonase